MAKIGLRRYKAVLYRRGTAVSNAGEAIDSYAPFANGWCSVEPRTTREIDATYLVEQTGFNLTFRYNESIESLQGEDLIIVNGVIYQPSGVPMNYQGRRREVRVHCNVVNPSTLPAKVFG